MAREAEERKHRDEEARFMAEQQRLRDEAQRAQEEKEAQERARAEQEENERLQRQVSDRDLIDTTIDVHNLKNPTQIGNHMWSNVLYDN